MTRLAVPDRLAWVLLGVMAVPLTWNLPRYPAPWFDEGQHITAAATLARHGTYGLPQGGSIDLFDPEVQVGPPVIVPVALAFRLFPIEVVTARAVVVCFALVTAWLYWQLARRLSGAWGALLALAFLLAGTPEPFASFAYLGRQVLGEVTALGWLSAALLVATAEPGRPGLAATLRRAVGAGFLLGGAMLCKGQLLFIGTSAFGLAWLIDRRFLRRRDWYEVPAMLVVGVSCVGGWQLVQWLALGPEQYGQNAAVLRSGLAAQIAAVSPDYWRNAAGALWRSGFLMWGLPGVAMAVWRMRRPGAEQYRHVLVGSVALVSLVWFCVFSVGWARYAFYATALLPIWAGDAVLTLWERWRPPLGPWRRVARFALAVGLAVILAWQSHVWVAGVLWPADTGFVATRAYLQRSVPAGARVESWEFELQFDEHPLFLHPNLALMYDLTREIMSRRVPVPGAYDPLANRPDYILQGEFGGWTGIYDEVLKGPRVRKLVQFGQYALYDVREAVAAREAK